MPYIMRTPAARTRAAGLSNVCLEGQAHVQSELKPRKHVKIHSYILIHRFYALYQQRKLSKEEAIMKCDCSGQNKGPAEKT